MGKNKKTAITPTRMEDYPEWYQQVVKASDMAENSPVRGCMVIKPWGYALWERMVAVLDAMFKETGVKNAYFPLFIPLSFLEKEAEHVEGFAKECAVVTHHRLEAGPDGRLVPAGRLNEPLIVRPTSETIIGDAFSKWVTSYRDLPLLINQWANVVRWEMRTRTFLRTSEFLWQEGHTAHASEAEALERTRIMLDIYADFVENWLAMPVIRGVKTPSERFPGAVETFCIEAMMQDRKALQAGTSHFLGQNFAKASDIRFQGADGADTHAWTTSWGASTRMIGGMIMTHGDDDGVIMPPKVAPAHVVLLPVFPKDADPDAILAYTRETGDRLRRESYGNRPLSVEIDSRDMAGRNWEWIKKGVPIRLEMGPRDMAEDGVFLFRRDTGERFSVKRENLGQVIRDTLDAIQSNLYERALAFRNAHTVLLDDKESFYDWFTSKSTDKPEIHGGFAMAHWCGRADCEAGIKQDLSVTIRCVPLNAMEEDGKCIFCGERSLRRVVFAKAY
ncbi:proline--tRNA ligase [Desulfobotulus sp. H1]|uniref:Proline--tRNA ligase n=1 Tax=Desulfobotulus pelophilus TaxID=2823377 RepID=A0ABT3N6Z2_9BACT|nr:proline--tRNA ligase [Desulfobotulus pelophilus]MCW7753230.1 proline--tRNA ligase [Desulfobotulus pelophilus]